MQYQKLGNSDLTVSRLCLGCMSFGRASKDFHEWTLSPKDTSEIIAAALDVGIDFFDTANCYSKGSSEEYLGLALKALTPRDRVKIATKVYFNEGHLSKKAILSEIDGSLKRLGTDYVDLYIIHRFDASTPIEETMEALDSLVKAGKVRALGASAMYGYQFMNMQNCALQNGLTPFSSMQNHYNLLYREDERELIPVCRQFNVALTPYSPLAAGHLCRSDWNSNSLRSQTDKTARLKYDAHRDDDLKIVSKVAEIARERNTSMTAVSLSYLLSKSEVCSPIMGITKISQLKDAVKALDLNLDAAEIKSLEEPYIAHEVVGAL